MENHIMMPDKYIYIYNIEEKDYKMNSFLALVIFFIDKPDIVLLCLEYSLSLLKFTVLNVFKKLYE